MLPEFESSMVLDTSNGKPLERIETPKFGFPPNNNVVPFARVGAHRHTLPCRRINLLSGRATPSDLCAAEELHLRRRRRDNGNIRPASEGGTRCALGGPVCGRGVRGTTARGQGQ